MKTVRFILKLSIAGAFAYLEELQRAEKYRDIKIEKIEETENRAAASRYNYYYVPCFYVNEEKVSEGAVDKQGVKEILDKIIG